MAGTFPPGSPATISDRTCGMLQIDPFFLGQFCQTQRVSRRAADDRRRIVAHHLQPALARQSARRQTERTEPKRPVKRRPEAEERPEGKRKRDDVVRRHSRDSINLQPARDDPIPTRPTCRANAEANPSCPMSDASGRSGAADRLGSCRTAATQVGSSTSDCLLVSGNRARSSSRPQIVRFDAGRRKSLASKTGCAEGPRQLIDASRAFLTFL